MKKGSRFRYGTSSIASWFRLQPFRAITREPCLSAHRFEPVQAILSATDTITRPRLTTSSNHPTTKRSISSVRTYQHMSHSTSWIRLPIFMSRLAGPSTLVACDPILYIKTCFCIYSLSCSLFVLCTQNMFRTVVSIGFIKPSISSCTNI